MNGTCILMNVLYVTIHLHICMCICTRYINYAYHIRSYLCTEHISYNLNMYDTCVFVMKCMHNFVACVQFHALLHPVVLNHEHMKKHTSYMCIYTCLSIHMHMCIGYTHTHAHMHAHMHARTHPPTHTHIHTIIRNLCPELHYSLTVNTFSLL